METVRLRQPKGLPVLFFAELWERFGFYCIQALLVLFLTQKLQWGDKRTYDLFSAFSALIYATPVIGGYLADRWLGYRASILIGAVLYLIGYLGLSSGHQSLFDYSLAALICGNGFFKPNVSTLLGKLYDDHDPRRDSGFTLFYMGINIGVFLAPIVCTYIAVNYGWNYGFLSAGVGILVSLTTCVLGFKGLGKVGLAPKSLPVAGKLFLTLMIGVVLVAIGELLHQGQLVTDILIAMGVVAFTSLLTAAFFEDREHRNRLIALIILMIFSIVFWAMYTQAFSSVTLFVQRNVNRDIFGYTIPAGMFSSMEGFFVIVLSPLFALAWLHLNKQKSTLNPSTAMKFAVALVMVGLSFLLLVAGIKFSSLNGLIYLSWMVIFYLMLALGELTLSPIGLSAVTSLAPPKLVGMVMGIWFLSLSAAYAVGGKIADLTAIPKNIASDPQLSLPIYQTNFLHFGEVSIAIGIVLMALVPLLKKMMQE